MNILICLSNTKKHFRRAQSATGKERIVKKIVTKHTPPERRKAGEIGDMVLSLLGSVLHVNFSWLSETLALLSSWRSVRAGFICCSRSATAQLIVRQRGVASELTNVIPGAVTATESLEHAVKNYLPPKDNLCTTLSSPQFSQALSMFWSALQSGQAGPMVRQFGLGSEAVNAAATGNIEQFVTALESETNTQPEAQTQEEAPSQPPPESADKKDDDDEEGMALDQSAIFFIQQKYQIQFLFSFIVFFHQQYCVTQIVTDVLLITYD